MASVSLHKSWRVDLAKMPIIDRSVMEMVGREVREVIARRTLAGRDAEGRDFEPYSAGYAERKSEAVGTTRVDLSVSGEMLGAMQVVEITDRKVVIGWRR